MALRQRRQFADCEHVTAIAAGVAADERAPSGEWFVRLDSTWESGHPVVQAHPEWFVPFGRASTSAPYFPPREPS